MVAAELVVRMAADVGAFTQGMRTAVDSLSAFDRGAGKALSSSTAFTSSLRTAAKEASVAASSLLTVGSGMQTAAGSAARFGQSVKQIALKDLLAHLGAGKDEIQKFGAAASIAGGLLGGFAGAAVTQAVGALASLAIGAVKASDAWEFLRQKILAIQEALGTGDLLGIGPDLTKQREEAERAAEAARKAREEMRRAADEQDLLDFQNEQRAKQGLDPISPYESPAVRARRELRDQQIIEERNRRIRQAEEKRAEAAKKSMEAAQKWAAAWEQAEREAIEAANRLNEIVDDAFYNQADASLSAVPAGPITIEDLRRVFSGDELDQQIGALLETENLPMTPAMEEALRSLRGDVGNSGLSALAGTALSGLSAGAPMLATGVSAFYQGMSAGGPMIGAANALLAMATASEEAQRGFRKLNDALAEVVGPIGDVLGTIAGALGDAITSVTDVFGDLGESAEDARDALQKIQMTVPRDVQEIWQDRDAGRFLGDENARRLNAHLSELAESAMSAGRYADAERIKNIAGMQGSLTLSMVRQNLLQAGLTDQAAALKLGGVALLIESFEKLSQSTQRLSNAFLNAADLNYAFTAYDAQMRTEAGIPFGTRAMSSTT